MMKDHLEILITLARMGLAARCERMPPEQISAAASALAAGESQLVVLQHQASLAERKDGP